MRPIKIICIYRRIILFHNSECYQIETSLSCLSMTKRSTLIWQYAAYYMLNIKEINYFSAGKTL